ncbi:MAG: hypothetical protein OXI44_11575 [Bacteroidota bacterium]|nr:hypothetical protein [Bacteroidota bacterium]
MDPFLWGRNIIGGRRIGGPAARANVPFFSVNRWNDRKILQSMPEAGTMV